MVVHIGIIGFGWVARDYMLPAIEAHPGATLRAVVSPDPRDFAGLPTSVSTYADATEMLEGEPELDAIYVASPNHLHYEHARLALEQGLPVLCEKPLTIDPAHATALENLARSRDRALLTAYDQRWHPAHQLMRRWIAEQKLGTLTQIRIDYACWLPADWTENNWRIDPERAGGGATIDLAPHGLDLTEFLTGARLENLHVTLQRVAHDYPVDDGGALTGLLDNGALLNHTVGYNRPDALPRRRLEAIGTRGMLVATDTMGQVAGGQLHFVSATDGTIENLDFDPTAEPFAAQFAGFLETITTNKPCTSGRTIADDTRLTHLLHEALTRATENTPVCP